DGFHERGGRYPVHRTPVPERTNESLGAPSAKSGVRSLLLPRATPPRPRAVCAISPTMSTPPCPLFGLPSGTVIVEHERRHAYHAQGQWTPDRRGSGSDRYARWPGAAGAPPKGRPAGGSRCPVPLWRVRHQTVL